MLTTSPMRPIQREHGQDWERSPLGLYMPPRVKRRYDLPVAVDLFAGAGGFGMGFHQAGFHVAAASEMWTTAACTYLVNLARYGHVNMYFDTPEREAEMNADLERSFRLDARSRRKYPGLITGREDVDRLGYMTTAGAGWIASQPSHVRGCEHFFVYDIKNLTGEMILDALGLDFGDVAVVMGGPPCQGFSAAGKQDVMDPRNSLVFEFARLVCEIQPRTFVMENVPRMATMTTPEGIPVLDALAIALCDGGYGEYDALRKSLAANPGARAGLRKSKRVTSDKDGKEVRSPRRRGKGKKRRPAADSAAEQLDLFGGAA